MDKVKDKIMQTKLSDDFLFKIALVLSLLSLLALYIISNII